VKPFAQDAHVTAQAVRQARALGIRGDVEERVRGLLSVSTPVRSGLGNLRAGRFVLLVKGTSVLSVSAYGPVDPERRSEVDCAICAGRMALPSTARGVTRHCPRYFNRALPPCDEKERDE